MAELTTEAIAAAEQRLAEAADAAEERENQRSLAEVIAEAEQWIDEADDDMQRMSTEAEENKISYETYDSARFDYWEAGWDWLGTVIAAYRREEQRRQAAEQHAPWA